MTQHIVIIGGGTAGITIAARLLKARLGLKICIIDPARRHYYQPLWTLVGGGLAQFDETDKSMAEVMPKGVTWVQQRVTKINADDKSVTTDDGQVLAYSALIVVPGIRLAYEEVDGLIDALKADTRVWTSYSPAYVNKGLKALEAFSGGDAIFTFPNSPVKCGGGPQKIMWIVEDALQRTGRRSGANVHFVAPGGAIFGVPKYRDALQILVDKRGIDTHFGQHVAAVDHDASTVTIETTATGERKDMRYDLLHITPPQRAFDFVKESGLGDSGGFVDVNRETLQHVRNPEVFSAGDASNLPTAKTGAAVRKQAPIWVKNLLRHLDGHSVSADYDGYTSCPLVVSDHEVILAEFGYDGAILETFPFNQAKPRRSMYFLKRNVLPHLYFKGMLKGRA